MGKYMLWGDYLNPETRTILSIFYIAGVPHQMTEVDTLKGEHKLQTYLSVNPTGTIPMITDGGYKIMGGSQVFLNYLCNSQ
jgi:glutathione S-transferase